MIFHIIRFGTHRFMILALLMLALPASVSLSQSVDRDNAAMWYQRAIESYERIPESQRELVLQYMRDPKGAPSIEVRNAVRKASEAFSHLRRGSEQDFNDLGLDYSQGWELLLPHLQPLRDLGRFAQADALIQLESGNVRAMVDRMATLYSLSQHMTSDRILISSLVGQSIYKGADDVVQKALDQAAIGTLESKTLLRALQSVDRSDPFDYVEAMVMEQTIGVEWLGKLFDDPEERMNAHEQFDWLTNDESDALALAGMTNEEFQEDLAGYDAAMSVIVEIFLMEDKDQAKVRLDELEQQLNDGQLGLLAGIMVPSLSTLFDRKSEAQKMVQDRMEVLSGLFEGTMKPEAEANAALFYLQGIATIEATWDEQQLAHLRELDAHPERPIDEAFASLLMASSEVIDVFREGSLKRRCDFSLYRQRPMGSLAPVYAAGMRDAFRLLHLDALHQYRAGHHEEVIDRLAIIYRITGHLSSDEPLAITLIAHEGFITISPLTLTVSSRSDFSHVQRFQLFDAIDSIPLRDPFGFIISMMKTRESITSTLITMSPRLERSSDESVSSVVSRFNGDHLVYLQTIFDTLARSADQEDATNDEELRRLDDVLSWSELEATRNQVSRIAPMIALGDVHFFGQRSIPLIASYVDRQRRARADLRHMLSRLRPTFAPTEVEASGNSQVDR